MSDTLTISVTGTCATGKTTLVTLIKRALEQVGIPNVQVVSIDFPDRHQDLQARRLDALARKLYDGKLQLVIREVQLRRGL